MWWLHMGQVLEEQAGVSPSDNPLSTWKFSCHALQGTTADIPQLPAAAVALEGYTLVQTSQQHQQHGRCMQGR
jgi:hypothetical protein